MPWISRRLSCWLPLVGLLSFAAPASAVTGLTAGDVSGALAGLTRAPSAPDALARFETLLPALAHLAPSDQRKALERLARAASTRAPLLAARAQLALTAHHPQGPWRDTLIADLGFLRAWSTSGPDGEADADAAHRALLAAGGAAHRWVAAPPGGPAGAISLEHARPPDKAVSVHAVAQLISERPRRAVLRLGASGALAVSLNGHPIGIARGLGAARADQLYAEITLPQGTSWLAVTLAPGADRRATLYARLTDRRARPLAGVSLTTTARGPPQLTPRGVAQPSTGLHWLGGRPPAAAAPPTLDTLRHAAFRRSLSLPDLEAERGALLEDLLLTEVAATAPAADLLQWLAWLPREEARASVLLHLIASGRRDPALKLALAELAGARGQPFRARQLLDELTLDPSLPLGRVALTTRARIDRLDGRPAPSWPALRDAAAAASATETVLVEAASAAAALDRPDLAAALYQRLTAALPGRLDHQVAHAQALLSTGRLEAARAIYERLVASRPDLLGYRLEAARLAAAADDHDTARALLAAATERAAHDASALEAIGAGYERIGALDAAITHYEQALALRPASPDVRAALERLSARAAVPAPFVTGVDAGVMAAPSLDPDAAFEVLSQEIVIDVEADGSATRWVRRVLRVQQVPDDRDARSVFVRFDPSREAVRVLDAQVYRSGLRLPVSDRETVQLSESWYGLYYNLRELVIPFDDLVVDDVVQVSWRVDAIGQLFDGVFDVIELLQSGVPTHRLRVVVDSPAALQLRHRLHVPTAVTAAGGTLTSHTLRAPADRRRLEVRGADLPALIREPLMPGSAEVGATWQVTSFESWDAANTWYQALIAPQQVVTPAMRAFARAAATAAAHPKAPTSETLLTRAIVDAVTSDVRYVGLEFGIHGYQPYRTDHVWVRRFGDCKDQATLLVTLLAEVGIEARVVLVRTRPQGRVPDPLPGLALFDHAIVWLPDRDLYVDPTAHTFGLGELPGGDQGAQVLVLGPPADDQPTALRLTPNDTPARSGIDASYSVTLRRDGSANIAGAVTFRGVHAPPFRARMADAATRAETLENVLNRRYPGLRLGAYEVSDPSDRANPLEVSFEAEVPGLASPSGATLQVRRPAGIDGDAERLAGPTTRRHPLVIGPPHARAVEFRYILPAGHAVAGLPASAAEDSAFGRYSVTWVEEPGAVRVASRLVLESDQITPADYPAFRAFLTRWDEATRPPLILAPRSAEVTP